MSLLLYSSQASSLVFWFVRSNQLHWDSCRSVGTRQHGKVQDPAPLVEGSFRTAEELGSWHGVHGHAVTHHALLHHAPVLCCYKYTQVAVESVI